MTARVRVLVVDDEPSILQTYATALVAAGYDVELAASALSFREGAPPPPPAGVNPAGPPSHPVGFASAAEAKVSVSRALPRAALVDLRMADEDGLSLLDWLHHHAIDVPVAIVTAHGDVPTAVEAMRRGAHDFVVKPSHPSRLRELVARLVAPPTVHHEVGYPSLVARAVQLGRAGDLDRAWLQVRLALAYDPARPEALNVLGVLTERRGERLAAQSFHRAALALDPTFGPSRENLERLTSPDRFGSPVWGDE